MAFIELNNVSVGFGSGSNRVEVLSDINLSIERGEFVALLGFSGSGKTTLVNLIAGLIIPDTGKVIVDGKQVTGPGPERGLVFQNYSLLPWLSVYQNVSIAVDQVFQNESSKTRRERVLRALDRVNLTDALHKKPDELSGGMRQRTSVARTLSVAPETLLLDEPLSALDALTRSVIQDEILSIRASEGQTVILVTNDIDEALYMADRIIPLGVGPAATLGPETIVDAPLSRDRRVIASNPKFQEWRNEVIGYLLREKTKERQRSSTAPVQLPNIRPMDISRSRPNRYLKLRPKQKKTLARV